MIDPKIEQLEAVDSMTIRCPFEHGNPDKTGLLFAKLPAWRHQDDARRAAASWNACIGFDIETLELAAKVGGLKIALDSHNASLAHLQSRIAELELEIVPVREMLEDARTQLDMIREALGVTVEPHQSLFERVMESAQRVKALEQELKTERCLSFRNQVAELERVQGVLVGALEAVANAAMDIRVERTAIANGARSALAAAQKQEGVKSE